jgi:mono/diheme cytochrome c family protein
MSRSFPIPIASLALFCAITLVESPRASAADKPTAAQLKHFEQHIRPLLLARCLKCHGAKEQKSGLRLDSLAGMLKGGESGPAIVPGKPDESMLIEAVRYESYEMPPDGQLKDHEVAALVKWIELGAPWPDAEAALDDGRKITAEDRAVWSFQPVAKVEPPDVDDGGWSQNEIDRFIFHKLQEAGL